MSTRVFCVCNEFWTLHYSLKIWFFTLKAIALLLTNIPNREFECQYSKSQKSSKDLEILSGKMVKAYSTHDFYQIFTKYSLYYQIGKSKFNLRNLNWMRNLKFKFKIEFDVYLHLRNCTEVWPPMILLSSQL